MKISDDLRTNILNTAVPTKDGKSFEVEFTLDKMTEILSWLDLVKSNTQHEVYKSDFGGLYGIFPVEIDYFSESYTESLRVIFVADYWGVEPNEFKLLGAGYNRDKVYLEDPELGFFQKLTFSLMGKPIPKVPVYLPSRNLFKI